jgi:hypothetical protein
MHIQINATNLITMEGIIVFHDACVHGLVNMKLFVDIGLSISDISPFFICLLIVFKHFTTYFITYVNMITCNPL